MELDIIDPDAAGIDVGSRSHYVAVGQSLEDVKEFGVYAEDLTALCEWLPSYGITSVAMESTGDYWQNLYAELMKHGIEVVLFNGKFTKHAKGKKTDVKDCRHLQKLHALGLLQAAFYPMKPQKNYVHIAVKGATFFHRLPGHPAKCRNTSSF